MIMKADKHLRIAALRVGLIPTLFITFAPMAWAQQSGDKPAAESGPSAEAAKQASSATTAAALEDDPDRPTEGPGSLISVSESEPPRPPRASEVEAEGFEAEVARMEKELGYYQQGASSFAQDMRDLIKLKYNEQRDQISDQYDQAITKLEDEERNRRQEAIARFKEFLRKYPNDPIYTPDAMFRLAELYFEKSSDDYLRRSRSYENELLAFERGERPDEPLLPEPTYEDTIGLHKDLLLRFPDYRLADAARYLLGYCYGEQNQTEEALASYVALVDNHPNSKFLAEVWTRIGEIHFEGDDEDSLSKAIAAYRKVQQFPDSPYFDKALYKIAWSYYRLDEFDKAVTSFVELVDYADKQKSETGISGSELRAEAIQYIAISLADEGWGGLDRAKGVLGPIESRDYTGELWKRYGEILYDQTRYQDAIGVLGYTINKYPNASYNPEAQEKIVRAYEQLRNFDGATAAREKLVKDYSKGSAWYTSNEQDQDAITKAESLTERSLYTAAIFRHQQAQAYKKSGRLGDARESYVAAANAYEKYLNRFPSSKNSYDFEFFLAECLYYSDDFKRAAAQYDKVRDSKIDNKHLEGAALSSVLTYEKEVERAERSGAIPKFALLTAAQRKGKKVEPKEIHPTRKKLIEASDRFVTLLPKNERAPAVAYRAAEVFYRHDQYDEARKRFEKIVADYAGSDVARYAGNLIIESYLATNDLESVRSASKRLEELASKAPVNEKDKAKQEKFKEDMISFQLGALFKQAEGLEAEGRFEDSANKYVELVNLNPKHEFADKALFNAARSYEKVKRYDTASGIYKRIYDKYPNSELAPRALFRVGINAEKGFDFPAAIDAYDKLVNRYKDSENRADALYNQAVVLENMQRYSEAAEAFKRYAITFNKRKDAGEIFFRAATVYEKMKDWPKVISTLNDYIKRYKRDSNQKERLIHAHRKIGDAQKIRGRERTALAAYRTCVSEFNRKRISVRGPAGRHAAHCSFELAEAKFREYDAIQIKGSGRKLVRALQAKAKKQREVEKAYKDVFKYKRVETTLASSYRIGYSYERFAESLYAAPVPRELQKDEELVIEYRAQLEEKAAVLERKAEGAYRKAYDEAKKTGVTNEWTQRILEGLNKYSPKEFPIQKRGKALMQTNTITGNGLDSMNTGKNQGKKPGANNAGAPGGARTANAGDR